MDVPKMSHEIFNTKQTLKKLQVVLSLTQISIQSHLKKLLNHPKNSQAVIRIHENVVGQRGSVDRYKLMSQNWAQLQLEIF